MKMESNPTTTVAELWRELSAMIIERDAYNLKYGFKHNETFHKAQVEHGRGKTTLKALRAELLERCVLEYGLKIHSEADGSAWIYETWISPTRICGINDTRNRAASLNFMAWELEQRQRESTATAETTQQQP